MKITVFNDTSEDWKIHIGSSQGVNGEHEIPKQSFVNFEGPDKSELFLKVWDNLVMVRFEEPTPVDKLFDKAGSALFKARWGRPLHLKEGELT